MESRDDVDMTDLKFIIEPNSDRSVSRIWKTVEVIDRYHITCKYVYGHGKVQEYDSRGYEYTYRDYYDNQNEFNGQIKFDMIHGEKAALVISLKYGV